MNVEAQSRYRQAAIAYALAGAVALAVAGTLVPEKPVAPVLLLPSGLLVMLVAYFVSRGVRWLTIGIACLSGLRAMLHLLCYAWPEPLFWLIRPLGSTIQLADGTHHAGYLVSGGLLAFATTLLLRAVWPSVPPAASPTPSPAA